MSESLRGACAERVLFAGYYGRRNTGDDSFCAVGAWGARRFWGSADVRLLCRQLPALPVSARAALLPARYLPGQTLIETAWALGRTPLLVWAGGSIFHSTLNRTQRLICRLHGRGRLRLGALGVSLGPFRSRDARDEVERFLRRFSFLVLRDRASYEEARRMDLGCEPRHGADLAALLPEIYPAPSPRPRDSRPLLGVALCHHERYTGGDVERERRREERILETLRATIARVDARVRLFVFNGSRDRGDGDVTARAERALAGQAELERVDYLPDPGAVWARVCECDAMFSVRLHGAVFAHVGGVPFVLVEYHRKCGDFLAEIGYPDHLRVGDMASTPAEAAGRLERVLTGGLGAGVMPNAELARRARDGFMHALDG